MASVLTQINGQPRVKWNTDLKQALQQEFSDNGFIAKLISLSSQVRRQNAGR